MNAGTALVRVLTTARLLLAATHEPGDVEDQASKENPVRLYPGRGFFLVSLM